MARRGGHPPQAGLRRSGDARRGLQHQFGAAGRVGTDRRADRSLPTGGDAGLPGLPPGAGHGHGAAVGDRLHQRGQVRRLRRKHSPPCLRTRRHAAVSGLVQTFLVDRPGRRRDGQEARRLPGYQGPGCAARCGGRAAPARFAGGRARARPPCGAGRGQAVSDEQPVLRPPALAAGVRPRWRGTGHGRHAQRRRHPDADLHADRCGQRQALRARTRGLARRCRQCAGAAEALRQLGHRGLPQPVESGL